MKTSALFLLALGVSAPLLAQKKLALANECFNAQAYYLACRYYQEAFENIDPCHPDQLKFAQSLMVTQQLSKADQVYLGYINCQNDDSNANIAYGKFLMNIQAYDKAIPYFQQSMEDRPKEASYYLLACQKAIPYSEEEITPQFVHQEAEVIVPKVEEVVKEDTQTDNLDQRSSSTIKSIITESSAPEMEEKIKKPNIVRVEKKISPFGVRLGTYMPSKVPSLSSVENFGTLEEKVWDGKVIYYLVGFYSREEAEVAVKLARAESFRSAILVEKQASGRMKSIQ